MLNFFEKKYEYVGIDIGTSSIKLVSLSNDREGSFSMDDFGVYALEGNVFSQNAISKQDLVSDKLKEIASKHSLVGKKVVTSVPAPALFTKRQRVPRLSLSDLREHIEFEASNFIPHGAESVYLDFHIIGPSGKSHYDVMVVAVKRDVVDSFLSVFQAADMSVGVVDVDQFALQNVFELNYPGEIGQTVALVNIGSRYTGINICRDGQCLLTGDVGLGSRNLSEEIAEAKEVSLAEAEALKCEPEESVEETVQEFVEYAASELSRQISYFWSASGVDGGIDKILVSGGGSLLKGLMKAIEQEAATPTSVLNPVHSVSLSPQVKSSEVDRHRSCLAVATGLALRAIGDKSEPES
jgi:type IV pilus assembly protein PilM